MAGGIRASPLDLVFRLSCCGQGIGVAWRQPHAPGMRNRRQEYEALSPLGFKMYTTNIYLGFVEELTDSWRCFPASFLRTATHDPRLPSRGPRVPALEPFCPSDGHVTGYLLGARWSDSGLEPETQEVQLDTYMGRL